MYGTTLPTLLMLFTVMTVPVMATGIGASAYFIRNFVIAVFLTVVATTAHWATGIAIFLAGACMCGGAALASRREGMKLLAIEPAMAVALILLIVILKSDAGGLFQGRGLTPTLTHLDGLFYKLDLAVRTAHFGVFTAGGIAGIFASKPLKPILLKKLHRLMELREFRRRRALPEAAIFGNRLFAPWRIIKRERRRLSARINRATLR